MESHTVKHLKKAFRISSSKMSIFYDDNSLGAVDIIFIDKL